MSYLIEKKTHDGKTAFYRKVADGVELESLVWPHTGAVMETLEAWNSPGPVPAYHRRAKRKLRREWPALAGALDLLTSHYKGDPEPRR